MKVSPNLYCSTKCYKMYNVTIKEKGFFIIVRQEREILFRKL